MRLIVDASLDPRSDPGGKVLTRSEVD